MSATISRHGDYWQLGRIVRDDHVGCRQGIHSSIGGSNPNSGSKGHCGIRSAEPWPTHNPPEEENEVDANEEDAPGEARRPRLPSATIIGSLEMRQKSVCRTALGGTRSVRVNRRLVCFRWRRPWKERTQPSERPRKTNWSVAERGRSANTNPTSGFGYGCG